MKSGNFKVNSTFGHHRFLTVAALSSVYGNLENKDKLDLRSTMSSPRTGVLSLIRFNSGQDKDLLD